MNALTMRCQATLPAQGHASRAAAASARRLPCSRAAAATRRLPCPPPRAAGEEAQRAKEEPLTGVVFQPFEEVAPVLAATSEGGQMNSPKPEHSFARMHYLDAVEAAMNEQINVELNISYVYLSMASYFDRDNVSLPGVASYFRSSSDDERGHAQMLIDFQNTRGGRVKLGSLVAPLTEFFDERKGDALYAFELALSLEKLNFDKLLALWEVADKNGDAQITHFIENMLDEQAEDIKKAADYVAQLRRVGAGLGVWQFDHELYEGEVRSRTQGTHV